MVVRGGVVKRWTKDIPSLTVYHPRQPGWMGGEEVMVSCWLNAPQFIEALLPHVAQEETILPPKISHFDVLKGAHRCKVDWTQGATPVALSDHAGGEQLFVQGVGQAGRLQMASSFLE